MDLWTKEVIATIVASVVASFWWAIRTINTNAKKIEILERTLAEYNVKESIAEAARERRREEDREVWISMRSEMRQELKELRSEIRSEIKDIKSSITKN